MKSTTVIIVSISILLVFHSVANAEIRYTVVDIGTLGRSWTGVQWTEPHCINNNGQIVGYAVFDYSLFGFSYGPDGMVDLGSGGAFSINNHGKAVGTSYGRAVLFDTSGAGNHIYLGDGSAESINDHGQIVGADSSWQKALLFSDPVAGRYNVYLGQGAATSINNNGQIVGVSNQHATLFDSTGARNNIDLGGLGGEYSIAHAINDKGLIVGHSYKPNSYEWHATLFDTTGRGNNIDMGGGMAYSINESGQVVGTGKGPSYGAMLFDSTGNHNNILLNNAIDPQSGWDLRAAFHINDNGRIVAEAENSAGLNHAILLIPATTEESPWSFVHITDTHIGSSDLGFDNRTKLAAAVYEINTKVSPKPKFIVFTGDIAHYGCNSDGSCVNHYEAFLEAIREIDSEIEIHTVPGNHEYADEEDNDCSPELKCYHESLKDYCLAFKGYFEVVYWFSENRTNPLCC